jgi:transposase, IS5 family
MLIVSYPCDEAFLDRAPFPVQIESKLLEMDRRLEDSKLLLQVTNDLAESAPQAWDNGRPSTPAEVTLRMSVVRRLMGWSYETAYQEIKGDVKWRWFCRIYAQPVPSDSTQQAREALIRPETLQRLNQRLMRLAQAQGVTQGRKLRMDGTVIETHIHYPTDSRLLADSARVLGRLLSRARRLLRPQTVADKQLFRNRARQAAGPADRTAGAPEEESESAGKQGAADVSPVAQGGSGVAPPGGSSGTALASRGQPACDPTG